MFKSIMGQIDLCDTMLGIFCLGVCVGASQRIPLSVLARKPHKGPAREISHETGRTMEGMSERRQKKTVSRRDQSKEQVSQGDESRAERRPVNRNQKGGC